MVDIFTKEQRSHIMQQVKSSCNKSTELRLISYFKANHIIGWRRNFKLFGNPDFTFPKIKTVVFVDGCFWHGHNCRNTKPQDNIDYWKQKIENNRKRDIEVSKTLQQRSWKVIRIWECELKNAELLGRFFVLLTLQYNLESNAPDTPSLSDIIQP